MENFSDTILVVGLGNPGKEYQLTRHNVGFMTIEVWCERLGIKLANHRFDARIGTTKFGGKDLVFLCPLTYMNRSGASVKTCADYYHLTAQSILVVHDDLDLPLGRVKVVRGGGAGGHKGVMSIVEQLGTINFPRVKVGIGRPQYGEAIEDYVLSPFYKDQEEVAEKAIQLAVRACELFILEGVDTAMTQINCQNLADKEVRS